MTISVYNVAGAICVGFQKVHSHEIRCFLSLSSQGLYPMNHPQENNIWIKPWDECVLLHWRLGDERRTVGNNDLTLGQFLLKILVYYLKLILWSWSRVLWGLQRKTLVKGAPVRNFFFGISSPSNLTFHVFNLCLLLLKWVCVNILILWKLLLIY